MKQIIYSIFIFLFIVNCSLNKVIKHHGVPALEKKQKNLIVRKTNINDIISLLGPPSTKSTFDKDLWIYIERATSSSKLTRLGKKKLIKNNVLILEINDNGMLAKKFYINKDNMNSVSFSQEITEMDYSKRTFIYNFLYSLREKINNPKGLKK